MTLKSNVGAFRIGLSTLLYKRVKMFMIFLFCFLLLLFLLRTVSQRFQLVFTAKHERFSLIFGLTDVKTVELAP